MRRTVYNCERLVISPQAALDYAVFAIEGMIETSSLTLADELPTVGESVTACISVGERQGFRDGRRNWRQLQRIDRYGTWPYRTYR